MQTLTKPERPGSLPYPTRAGAALNALLYAETALETEAEAEAEPERHEAEYGWVDWEDVNILDCQATDDTNAAHAFMAFAATGQWPDYPRRGWA